MVEVAKVDQDLLDDLILLAHTLYQFKVVVGAVAFFDSPGSGEQGGSLFWQHE